MVLGYNTNGLQNHRLDDALELLADLGYGAVALTLDVQHLDPLRCTSDDVDRIAGQLARLRLLVVIETGARFLLDPRAKHEPTLMSRQPEARARRLAFYARCAEIGADLGAQVLSFWTGIDRTGAPDAAAWAADGVRRTCELVRARGLVPALEPEPGMHVATCADHELLCGRLGGEAPALTLDVGHLYATGEGEPADVVARVGGRLAQVHIEDTKRGVHEHLLPGEGDVDFAAVRRALDAAGYGGPVCFELSRSSHMAPAAMRMCREAWTRAAAPRP
jgi:sugar phosphate isomerase/epimerase